MEVGIRELRSNLAAILEAVDRGATVTITHRGRRRAILSPVEPESPIARGLREGWLSAGPGYFHPRPDRRPRYTYGGPLARPLDEIIAEDRDDR